MFYFIFMNNPLSPPPVCIYDLTCPLLLQGRGDERERQQREQLSSMERKVESSIREADATENKLELMEAIIKKLKFGSEEIYIRSKCGATPVLSLLGASREKEIVRPFINENNIVMYLDMVNNL
jgi:hypothetical protein